MASAAVPHAGLRRDKMAVKKCESSKVKDHREVLECLNAVMRELLARGKATSLLAAEEQSEYLTQRRG
jgi:hypothetical protein